MKYALFVLGILLIAVGGYFLYAGSNIIEMERGWSSVIAGTTALTGGIITLGLAGIVKALEDLQAGLSARPALPAAVSRAPAREPMPAPASFIPATAELPGAADFAPQVAAAEPVAETESFVAAQEAVFEPPVAEEEPKSAEADQVPPPPTPLQGPAAASASAIAELRRRVARDMSLDWPSFKIPTRSRAPAPPASEPPPPAETPAEPLPSHDLDENLPRDLDLAAQQAETPHEIPEERPAETEAEPEPVVVEPEPVAREPAAPAPKPIGRYEADGTVYVMFSDGSIEAQSAQGTRRFKSMADLKASFLS